MQPRPIGTVLCAVDFSAATHTALDRAVDLARRYGAERLLLAHVVEIVRRDDDDARTLDAWVSHEEGVAARMRRLAEEVARSSGLQVGAVIRSGIAWREIVELARSAGADLVVVGAPEADASSTAEQLLRSAPCTVVAARRTVSG